MSWKSFHELHFKYYYTQLPSMLLFAHIFFMKNTFPYLRTNLFLTFPLSYVVFPQNTRYSSSPLVPLLELTSLSNGSWKSFPPINGPLIPHEPMKIENDFSLQWKWGWEYLCPMKHEGCSILQSNRMIILMTNGIWGLILFPILDILMGFLSSIMINFLHSTLTSYFFILIILSSYLLG